MTWAIIASAFWLLTFRNLMQFLYGLDKRKHARLAHRQRGGVELDVRDVRMDRWHIAASDDVAAELQRLQEMPTPARN